LKREVPKTAVVEVEVVSSLSVVVDVVEEPSSLLLLQEMKVKLKRNMEKMMSICLTRVPISGLGEPKIYHDSGVFYKEVGILLGVVSDCEELVGVTHRGMMGLVYCFVPDELYLTRKMS